MEEEHKLKIESLRDCRARCTCGRWSYVATSINGETNEELHEMIDTQFEFHRANVEYEERRLRERAEQSAQSWGQAKQLP